MRNIAIDLDGTILKYKGWHGRGNFDKPLNGALDFIKTLISRGHVVTIFTARSNSKEVQQFLMQNGFPELKVTSEKFGFDMLIDDRAVPFPGPSFYDNIDSAVAIVENFQPWWKIDEQQRQDI
jgi:hypothetical protein